MSQRRLEIDDAGDGKHGFNTCYCAGRMWQRRSTPARDRIWKAVLEWREKTRATRLGWMHRSSPLLRGVEGRTPGVFVAARFSFAWTPAICRLNKEPFRARQRHSVFRGVTLREPEPGVPQIGSVVVVALVDVESQAGANPQIFVAATLDAYHGALQVWSSPTQTSPKCGGHVELMAARRPRGPSISRSRCQAVSFGWLLLGVVPVIRDGWGVSLRSPPRRCSAAITTGFAFRGR